MILYTASNSIENLLSFEVFLILEKPNEYLQIYTKL